MKRRSALGTGVVGVVALLLAGCSSGPQPLNAQAAVSPAPSMVSCGEGRQAFVQQVNGVALVQCAVALPGDQGALLASSVPDRVVYAPTPQPRTLAYEQAPYRTYPRQRVVVRRGRSWQKSAAIIGGSTAAGAGLGAVLGGGSGAKKGAVVGLVGGTVFDLATRNH